jgi:hypothetical protein
MEVKVHAFSPNMAVLAFLISFLETNVSNLEQTIG